ncbi:MAG: toprim domain-containing protein [bacterium]|nr:toprim domain-containing protein [bacterium]
MIPNFIILPLPNAATEYLCSRGISTDLIKTMQIGWISDYKNNSWIALPVLDQKGNVLWHKLRRPPDSKATQKTLNSPGSKATLYGLPYIPNDRVVLCEGEIDVLVLLSHGIEAVCPTAGAKSLTKAMLEHLPIGIEVVLCFDLDDAGAKGKEKALALIGKYRPDIFLSEVCLPEELGTGGDIADFFALCASNEVDPVQAFFALKQSCSSKKGAQDVPSFEVRKLGAPMQRINYSQWSQVINSSLPELFSAAEASLSVVTQLLIKDVTNCFALVLIDVPSAGKTITINFFDELEGLTYSSDTFTPSSFVSNAANVKMEKLKDIDLLPRIRRKMFLVRDMATIFSLREDDLIRNMGILTRVLDGEGLSTDTGVHGRRALRGDYLFTMLAASTPIPLRVWKAMGTLGQRLFFLSLHTKTKSEIDLVRQLQSKPYKEKEAQCRSATQDLLRTLWNQYPNGLDWDRESDPEHILAIISRCALLLARLRGQVLVYRERGDSNDELSYTIPLIEKPDRINQCLYNFARGHALAMGRTQLTAEDIPIVLHITLDSAPNFRAPLFRELLRNNGKLNTGHTEKFLQCSDTTARKELKTLCLLKLCKEYDEELEPSIHVQLNDDLNWFLSKECQTYLSHTESEILGDYSKQI